MCLIYCQEGSSVRGVETRHTGAPKAVIRQRTGASDCNGVAYIPARSAASRVSYNRPYAGAVCDSRLKYGTGAGEFLVQISWDPQPGWEYNFIRWAEKQGYDATYCSSIDTHTGWPAGKVTKVFVSVGHDEYWSEPMRNNVEAKRDQTLKPVNLAFFSANVSMWKIQMHSGPNGVPNRQFSVNKVNSADYWRYYNNRHESDMVGVEHVWNSFPMRTIWNLTIPQGLSHPWIYTLTGIAANGTVTSTHTLFGVMGYEVDGKWIDNPEWLCSQGSRVRSGVSYITKTSFTAQNPNCPGITANGETYSSVYTAASGAQVFAVGSMNWNYALDSYGYTKPNLYPTRVTAANYVARQISHNVLRKFAGATTFTPVIE